MALPEKTAARDIEPYRITVPRARPLPPGRKFEGERLCPASGRIMLDRSPRPTGRGGSCAAPARFPPPAAHISRMVSISAARSPDVVAALSWRRCCSLACRVVEQLQHADDAVQRRTQSWLTTARKRDLLSLARPPRRARWGCARSPMPDPAPMPIRGTLRDLAFEVGMSREGEPPSG